MAAYKDEARGTWYVSFHYNDWTGKNKRKLKRGFRTRKEALEYEQKFLLQQATNLDMRFADFYKLYEEDLKPKLKLNTWRTKDVIFQKKLIPYFKDKKMNEISPADIIKWQNEMIKKRQADGKPYKPTYLETMQSELSAIFNHAVRFYNLRENPVKKAGTIGKGKADEMDFWTKEEYLKFIECVKDKPISYYAFQILYWCGIREGELLALTPADIDFPVWEGAKRGLSKKVSKRNVFTPQTLSVILQDKLRVEASYGFECYFKERLAEKKKGRNHDLSVTEYKVAQESRKLADIKQQNNEEQEKNTKLRSNNASISYQIATQEQRHSRNLDVIAADEDRLETVRSSINAAETEYAKYADMITDKKNNLELLSSKESELIERTKIAESVFDMFRQSGTDDVREKLIDVMYENQKLREENTTLKELLEKAYEFMKQFVIDGVNLLERFLESVGKVVGNVYKKTK